MAWKVGGAKYVKQIAPLDYLTLSLVLALLE
jgi:hypothetical protein